jgi:hypothetical protein
VRIVIIDFMSLNGVVQSMAAAWPGRADDPFADQMNAIPKYVASDTLSDDELTWNTPPG